MCISNQIDHQEIEENDTHHLQGHLHDHHRQNTGGQQNLLDILDPEVEAETATTIDTDKVSVILYFIKGNKVDS